MQNLKLETLMLEVTKIAREAGAFQLHELKKFQSGDIIYKGKNDLVSYVDKQTENLLIEKLMRLLPESSVLAEENGRINQADLEWVIDPLDGTTNFLHRLPLFAVSIGLRYQGKEIAGVVLEPNRDEVFYAWQGGGSFCNEERIYASNNTEASKALIATGFPYDLLNKTDAYFNIMKTLLQETHGLRRFGSAAVDLCYTACGRFDAYFEFNLKDWDVSAGNIIVREAGGEVSDYQGEQILCQSGKEIIAAGAIHPYVLEVVQKNWN